MASPKKKARPQAAKGNQLLLLLLLIGLASGCLPPAASQPRHDRPPRLNSRPFLGPASAGLNESPIDPITSSAPAKGWSCGKSSASSNRILGGQNATFAAWPWMVSLGFNYKGFWWHNCGGSLINHEWVLTAAHCVPDHVREPMKIRLGELNFKSVDEPLAHEERSAKEFIVHPDWNKNYARNDVALVRLDRPVEFGGHISPICLPRCNVGDLAGRTGVLTGWGSVENGGDVSEMQQTNMPIHTKDHCESKFIEAGLPIVSPCVLFCAGTERMGESSCGGDSGGPLQIRDESGNWFIAGIDSHRFIEECGLPGWPTMFTRVSEYLSWIGQYVVIED